METKTYKRLAKPYYVWLLILAIVPLIIMFLLSFVKSEGLSFEGLYFSMESFLLLLEASTVSAFFNSLFYALTATILCIIIGYFVAYRIFKSKFNNKFLILILLILPMWTNLLLRIEALGNLMEHHNMLQDLLSRIGIHLSIGIKGSPLAVIIGLVFTYLPFAILPIYTALEKIPNQLENASLDLGLTEYKTFFKVTLPLSFKGVVSAIIMVFLPSLSGFAIPQILGKGNIVMIGNLIEESFRNMNYNFGSLLAVLVLIFILGSIFIVSKTDKEGSTLL